ncbi:MAG: tripartite tricarboxylate transporter substrate binding protein [Natronospirillum sp.]|uniref:tripartite tricarboxylate transporter substrate binding protein n=1 Tax=Natronospirillum sp. TaxID=2812955 RepID=UPI0025CCC48A|nr:tripartite tricarboxylate transporter substrate binding protein [Natronospirillum sp.]MCH8552204.1 tripartite tricarboxylate transporter substrate binding protein [Natronospirillum sp.]
MRMVPCLALLVCLGLAAVTDVLANESFPSRPLTLLIGFNPGGSTDIQAQVLAEVMAEDLGQRVDILHFPGRGGGNAAAMLASSQVGGYVFQYGHSNPFVFTPLTAVTSYTIDSYRFVAGVALEQSAFVTGPDTPFANWEDMLAYGRERGDLIYVTQSQYDQLLIESIMEEEGINLRILPTSGGADMAPLIINGEAHFAFSGGTHSGYTDSGEMRMLASPTRDRLMGYPDVRTLHELGYDLEMHTHRIIVVPADTPEEHVTRLSEAAQRATEDQRFIDVTESRTRMPVTFINEDDLSALLAAQTVQFSEGLQGR